MLSVLWLLALCVANRFSGKNSGKLGVDQLAEIVNQEKVSLLCGGAALAGHDEFDRCEAASRAAPTAKKG